MAENNERQPKSLFRHAFNVWERTTAAYMAALVRNPMFLTANSAWLNGMLSAKKVADGQITNLVSGFGVSTRRDQEKMLHLLHDISGRLDDLEFRMDDQGAST